MEFIHINIAEHKETYSLVKVLMDIILIPFS